MIARRVHRRRSLGPAGGPVRRRPAGRTDRRRRSIVGARVVARRGAWALVFRLRLPVVLAAVPAAAVGTTAVLVAHHVAGGLPLTVAGIAVSVLAWARCAFRLVHVPPVGPGPDGPPGGAGVREPRRPLPSGSGGAAPVPSGMATTPQ